MGDPMLASKPLLVLQGHFLLLIQVGVVAGESDRQMFGRVCPEVCDPLGCLLVERVSPSYVIHDEGSSSIPVVNLIDGAETLASPYYF